MSDLSHTTSFTLSPLLKAVHSTRYHQISNLSKRFSLLSTMARTTRASARASAATNGNEPQQLSSPPATPLAGQGKKVSAKAKSVTPANNRKRSRKAIKQEDFDVNELPHNLGTALPTPVQNTLGNPGATSMRLFQFGSATSQPLACNRIPHTPVLACTVPILY